MIWSRYRPSESRRLMRNVPNLVRYTQLVGVGIASPSDAVGRHQGDTQPRFRCFRFLCFFALSYSRARASISSFGTATSARVSFSSAVIGADFFTSASSHVVGTAWNV